jgi:N-succinyldiaminopimelate aminotransferase
VTASFNHRLDSLQDYPFERLRALTANSAPNPDLAAISLSLGEPRHPPPDFVIAALSNAQRLQSLLATYPATRGSDELRASIAGWMAHRFGVTLDPETHVLPVNGSREALFSFAQAVLSGNSGSAVMLPNPFYQIYEGAALLAGAAPIYVGNDPANGYQQDFNQIDDEIWRRTELVYLCSPGNPTGQVMEESQMQQLIGLAHRHDFIVAADECYAEIYFDDQTPPGSLLSASANMGNRDFARCVVFHSLSKRSNLPGLRSGFVAGDAKILADYLRYRTYHGCAMGAHHQFVSSLAWQDEAHVEDNRVLYRRKFAAVSELLEPHFPLQQPQGGFYHWLPTPVDDQTFCQRLLEQYNVTVMPGTFLARDAGAGNPGSHHVRLAWVAELDNCITAAERLVEFVRQGSF